ncbi:MAG: STAS domain-containing protein [Saccharopolyspora sp.]|uniref:STAS domain-containing protein n=1 Tax=Saccharopolyspora sp. TaxID=33915 RepID=UPI0025DDC826|nr:STAS domain-containing protein [Saccharopolyspora sp.]MBQ6639733.1 STAS domain-containing protein [Saccharopolyspora sp.]
MRTTTPCPTFPAAFPVDGDITGSGTSALAERLRPHLLTAPPNTVLDLSAAGDIDDAGIDLLAAVRTYAAHRGLAFSVINARLRLQDPLLAAGVRTSAPQAASAPVPLHTAANA